MSTAVTLFTLTDQLLEQVVLQAAVGQAVDVLLWGAAGHPLQPRAGHPVTLQRRRADGKHPDVVALGFSRGPGGAARLLRAV